jgi:hypothetical protein
MKPESSLMCYTRAIHWSLFWARWIQSIWLHPISPRSILILSTTYILVFLVISFFLVFPSITNMHASPPHSCISHTYRTTGKITVLYILMFIFLHSRQEGKRLFWTEWQQAIPKFNLLISYWIKFWFVNVPKYFNSATFSKDLFAILI